MSNTFNINELDLTPYASQIEGYKLSKDKVINKSYTVEDVLIVGLRKLDREFKWQEKYGSQVKTNKLAEAEAELAKVNAKLIELGVNPDEL